MRGLAVVGVLLCHTTGYSGVRDTGFVSHAWSQFASALSSGVELFFVLSGFLITGILLDGKGGPNWIPRFYLRRTLRIFPLYYATLAVAFLLMPLLIPPDEAHRHLLSTQRWYWTYLTNLHFARWGWPSTPYLGHFWTLAIEEQFYLLWPAIVLVLSPTALRRFCVLGMATGLVLRTGLVLAGTEATVDLMTPTQLDGLLAGAWLAVRFREPGGIDAVGRLAPRVGGLSLAGILALVAHGGGWSRFNEPFRIGVQPLLALFFASLVALAAGGPERGSGVGRFFSGRILTTLGKYGYGYYVFHAPIVLLLHGNGWDARVVPKVLGSHLPGIALFTLVVGVLSLVAAVASYHLFESWFLRLKDRISPARRAPAAAAPASLRDGRTAVAEAADLGA